MAGHFRSAMSQVKLRLQSKVPVDVDALAREVEHTWRERLLSPATTVWLFMLQILNQNVAITGLRQWRGAASSYCEARKRLPLLLFGKLFDAMSEYAGVALKQSSRTLLNGRRVLIADVTTYSMPDTAPLRGDYTYPAGQKPALGFPVGRLLGVIDAISGCVLMALGCPLFTHEAGQMWQLHPLFKRGDILLADRAFCTYSQIALLANRGVDVVMRLHQRRYTPAMKDVIETWTRSLRCPVWLTPQQWAELPESITVRIVRYAVNRKNSRTRFVYVATTLLDKTAYPPEVIEQLYGHRWNIETCFNQLKTHARMNTLKCRTAEGVIKELIMYLIVWNLVRMTMLKFSQQKGVAVWRVSFIDTVRHLNALFQAPPPTELKLLINPERSNRWEPRKIKRRMKEYDLLKEPRQSLKSKHRARCN
jgi:hypothetical protein